MNKKLMTVVLVIISAFLILTFVRTKISCIGGMPTIKKDKKEVTKKTENLPVPVKAYKVAKVNFRDSLPSLGTIKGFREYDLKFATQGVVEYINFKEGEHITQGDIIASLDQKEQLLKLEYSKVEMDKQAKLLELGHIVETKLKQSQLEYQSAKAELDKTNLIAYSDGYIGAIEVDKGSFVSPQDKIGTFVDMKDVYVEFGVIEKDAGKIQEGQNVEVVLETYPDQVFKGKVDSVAPLVEGRSRTIKVRSKISNPDEKIKPGMFARVNVLVYEKENAIVVPSASIKKKEDQKFVYVVHLDEEAAQGAGKSNKVEESPTVFGTLEARNIEIAYGTPEAFEIKEGLEEGDLVVVDLEQEVQDKAKVEITETQEGIF